MILTAHQPMFLPWLGLFAKIAMADQFVIFDDVPFERHGFGNRNYIRTQNGAVMLTVPVKLNNHLDKPVRLIEIDNSRNGVWRRKHLRSIEVAYAKAPFFAEYFPVMQELYAKEWSHLTPLCVAMTEVFMRKLGINVPIVRASERGFVGQKSALVLDMCLKCGASEYIFGAQGRDYADRDAFARAGVKVVFQDYRHPVYPQIHGGFEPRMSVLDLLMNCGPRSLEILTNRSG